MKRNTKHNGDEMKEQQDKDMGSLGLALFIMSLALTGLVIGGVLVVIIKYL